MTTGSITVAGTISGRPFVSSPRGRDPAPAPSPLVQDWRQPLPTPAAPPAWSPRTGAVEYSPPASTGTLPFLGTIGITALVFILGAFMGDHLTGIGGWTYLAVWFAEFADAATPLIPTPAHAYTYTAAMQWSPFLVVLAATAGSALGETVGYLTGCRGHQAIQSSRLLRTCASRFGKWEGQVVIALAAIPVPVYLSGVWAGAFGVSYPRFLTYAVVGKLVLFGTLVFLAFFRG